VELAARRLQLEATLDAGPAPSPIAAILPATNGDVNCTQKANLLPATGTLRADGRQWNLAGALGGTDFTRGILPRKTAWRWAFALGRTEDGTPVGFNLTDGLSEASRNEHALWIGRELVPMTPPRFTFDANNPMGPWQVRTADGAIDLRFTAKGLHREERNLLLVRSHFVQVAGLFHGTVRDPSGRTHTIAHLPGVTEDQRVLW
jgi:hypothetical protein